VLGLLAGGEEARDPLSQVWFDSQYDIEVHAIELPGNSILPSTRASRGQLRNKLILPPGSTYC
jgi:hypothetical protein